MNRKGIAVDTLIQLAIVAIVLFVTFLGVYPAFEKKLHAAEEKGTCQWSVLLAAVRKAGSLSMAQGIPEGCHAKRKVITADELNKKIRFAGNRLKTMQNDKKYQATAPYFVGNSEKRTDTQLQSEFALDNIIGDELVECWEKVFKGRMPLFDEWWRLYNCQKDGKTEPCGKIDDFATAVLPAYGAVGFLFGSKQWSRAPTNCVVCAHITFSKDVKDAVGKTAITSLNEWMSNNPVPQTSTSYLEYLQEGQAQAGALFGLSNANFDMSDEGIAIVYERVNAQMLTQKFGISFGGVDKDQNVLKVMPYRQENLIAPQGDCTFVLD